MTKISRLNRRAALAWAAASATTVASPSLLAQTPAAPAAPAAPATAAAPAAASGRPIRLIVPYAAGGPIDATMRALAERVRDTLGTVIIENRTGAGGNIGADAVAKAAPDGLTIGVGAVATHAINPWLYNKIPYDPIRDFSPITLTARIPNVLVMNAETAQKLRINTVQDLVRYAKANPGKLNYGSGGNGSAGHLAGELFKSVAGLFIVHIPYAGGAPAQLALLSGQVDFNIDNLATAAPNIRAGKLKALAVTTPQRSPVLPDVPTFAEAGVKGVEVDTWWGLFAPARTPADVVQRLNAAFVAALATPEVRARYAAIMTDPVSNTPEQFAAMVRTELAKYEKIVKASGAKID
jgi:tripartite-type tricarboxylate transporter receptor subunit TctC